MWLLFKNLKKRTPYLRYILLNALNNLVQWRKIELDPTTRAGVIQFLIFPRSFVNRGSTKKGKFTLISDLYFEFLEN
jgi:hypothetical protein